MVSRWEVHAKDKGDIRVVTYSSSATTENLRTRRKATLIIADSGMAYYIKCEATSTRHADKQREQDSGDKTPRWNLGVEAPQYN
jgi:general stress protein 26